MDLKLLPEQSQSQGNRGWIRVFVVSVLYSISILLIPSPGPENPRGDFTVLLIISLVEYVVLWARSTKDKGLSEIRDIIVS